VKNPYPFEDIEVLIEEKSVAKSSPLRGCYARL